MIENNATGSKRRRFRFRSNINEPLWVLQYLEVVPDGLRWLLQEPLTRAHVTETPDTELYILRIRKLRHLKTVKINIGYWKFHNVASWRKQLEGAGKYNSNVLVSPLPLSTESSNEFNYSH